MKLSIGELQIINAVIQIDNEGKARQYVVSELGTALEIFNNLKSCTTNKEGVGDVFVDGEIEFSTEEKSFILKYIDGRSFTVLDAEFVLSLKEKLK